MLYEVITEFGELIREVLQERHDLEIHKLASLFGYMTTRANLVALEAIPRIENGENIIFDRYWYSTRITSYNVCYTKLLRPDWLRRIEFLVLIPQMSISWSFSYTCWKLLMSMLSKPSGLWRLLAVSYNFV